MWRIVKIFEILPICCFFFSFNIIFDNNYNKLSLWVARDCWTNIRTSFVPIIWMSQKDRDMDWVPDGWYTVWRYRVQTDDTICVHIRIIHRTTREKLWWQHCCSFWVAWVGQPPDIEPVNEVLNNAQLWRRRQQTTTTILFLCVGTRANDEIRKFFVGVRLKYLLCKIVCRCVCVWAEQREQESSGTKQRMKSHLCNKISMGWE